MNCIGFIQLNYNLNNARLVELEPPLCGSHMCHVRYNNRQIRIHISSCQLNTDEFRIPSAYLACVSYNHIIKAYRGSNEAYQAYRLKGRLNATICARHTAITL
jgi:hypothetical protein